MTIEYGAPSLKGRQLDELLKQLPADRIWRVGAGRITTLTVSGDAVTIGGAKVPTGKYSLYVHVPETGDVELVVNKDLGVRLGTIWAQAPENLKNEPWPTMDYSTIQGQEVARLPMVKTQVESPSDKLTFEILAPTGSSGDLELKYGHAVLSVGLQSADLVPPPPLPSPTPRRPRP